MCDCTFGNCIFYRFYKRFTVSDFQDSYNKLVYNFANSASKSKLDSNLFDTNNSNNKK